MARIFMEASLLLLGVVLLAAVMIGIPAGWF
jgi:hypothetical protein